MMPSWGSGSTSSNRCPEVTRQCHSPMSFTVFDGARGVNRAQITRVITVWAERTEFSQPSRETSGKPHEWRWLGGRDSHESFFVRLPLFAISRQVFQILLVRRLLSFHRPSSVCRLFRILRAQCHSKCHSLRASTQILLSERTWKFFANPAVLGRTYRD